MGARERCVAALAAGVWIVGCSFDWDRFEPRGGQLVRDGGDVLGTLDAVDVVDAGGMDQGVDVPGEGPCAACMPGQTCCAGACVNTAADPSHCGACEQRCPGTSCLSGMCTETCLRGRRDCDMNVGNGCETDLLSDRGNCGSCGTMCPTGRECANGSCACPRATADCNANAADGCEVDTAVDPVNCGACGRRCPAGQACVGGSCGCMAGTGDCDMNAANGCEVNLQTSAVHCGGCGRSCGVNGVCVAGMCQCAPGSLRCPPSAPEGCSVPATDPMNCGACGTICAGAMGLCSARGCVGECAMGETRCERSCVDTATDARHCGGCGRACGAHQRCVAGAMGGTPGCQCELGWGDCDGNAANGCEADLRGSVTSCGACGTACGAMRICREGRCECQAGLRDCGGGRCAECCGDGDCNDGMPCTTDRCVMGRCERAMCGAGTRCCGELGCRTCCGDGDCTMNRACAEGGMCSRCAPGFGDCDGVAANGCETRLDTVMHCGSCGTACMFPNATAACMGGRCVLGTCATNFADCDMNAVNGCEANTASSVAHCGRCGNACMFAGGTPACVGGTCQRTMCEAGRGDCDGNTANGCEADLGSDPRNCRACGMACLVPNATPACRMGVCAVQACMGRFGDCDGMAANGCEVNLSTDAMHCGACGMRCTFPNATGACVGGACVLGTCAPGFANCDGMAANGCEANLATSAMHCGGCGVSCGTRPRARTQCMTGSCGFTCDAGFADCDRNPANGCETNVQEDANHCGTCGNFCMAINATPVCRAGTCGIGACLSGAGNCDGDASNGCETDLLTDPNNCGGCARFCSRPPNASSACRGGTCGLGACNFGFGNCDGAPGNGCETSLNSDANNCGACRVACMAGSVCVGGRCARPVRTYAVGSPSSDVMWVDACAAAASLAVLQNTDDSITDQLGIPTAPFRFEFWGITYETFRVSSNGFVMIGGSTANESSIGPYIPFPGPRVPFPAVFLYARDLVQSARGTCITVTGVGGSRRVVIETFDATLFADSSTHVTFELILYEGSGVIDLLFNTPFSGSTGSPGTSATVGIVDHTGTRAVPYTGTLTATTRIRFTPML